MKAWVVEFKGNRLEHFLAPEGLQLADRDFVIVQCERGEDMGRLRRLDADIGEKQLWLGRDGELRKIVRVAVDEDNNRYKSNRQLETDSFGDTRERIAAHDLDMKLVDI